MTASTNSVISGLYSAIERQEVDLQLLVHWNDETEKKLAAPPEEQVTLSDGTVTSNENENDQTGDDDSSNNGGTGQATSNILLGKLLSSLHQSNESIPPDERSLHDKAQDIVMEWKSISPSHQEIQGPLVAELLRTCKNWMRWCLQIYQAQYSSLGDLILDYKSTPVLELFLLLFESLHDDEGARSASQLLFYATYNPVPGSDEYLLASFEYLLNENMLERLLKRLNTTTSVPLALSITRNVHNLIASYDKGAKAVNAVALNTVDWKASASWSQRDGSLITYKQTMRAMIAWALLHEPVFPGPPDDRRAELMTEILRCFFALRVGVELNASDTDASQLSSVVVGLLRLDTNDERSYECIVGTLPLLMDADVSFGELLLSQNVVPSLVEMLEKQMDNVISVNRIDNVAVAALTPILVVLHKFGSSNTNFRERVKECVFPPSEENYFQILAADEQKQNENDGKARNMSPLDAPLNTVRGKLIRLLTWPNGHIKRFTGELLWILCGSNPNEFIHRVGMGNAILVLNLKGIVALPSQIMGAESL